MMLSVAAMVAGKIVPTAYMYVCVCFMHWYCLSEQWQLCTLVIMSSDKHRVALCFSQRVYKYVYIYTYL